MGQIEMRLHQLGLELPPAPKPAASYVPAVRCGNLVYISGQGPVRDGKPVYVGKLGAELSVEEGYRAAQLVGLNALAVLKEAIGDLDKVRRIVKVLGFVASAPGFGLQPQVMNGFSDLMEKVFGERGRHARSAVGTNELPFGIPVEVEMIVEVDE